MKEVLVEILQNLQENTCDRDFFDKVSAWYRCFPVNVVKFENIFSYRTPPVAPSGNCRGEAKFTKNGLNREDAKFY